MNTTQTAKTGEGNALVVENMRCPKCGLFFMSDAQVLRHFNKRHGEVRKQSHLVSKDNKTAYIVTL